jgi:RimJ/RimL family protein N-acetyltransferase
MIKIRHTSIDDFDTVMNIYAGARLFMQENGNENQWINGYPSGELIIDDIKKKNSYVCINPDNEIIGTFCFILGDDITYAAIYDGCWLNDEPYGVIHRLAGKKHCKKIAASCLQWCFEQCSNIRVDTHSDNIIMQNILTKNGFARCGIIYVGNGTSRIAYQKTLN